MLFRPTAVAAWRASAAAKRAANPAALPSPSSTACSATASRRTISSAADAGRLPHPGQVEQAGPDIAGVEQEMSDPAGPQQPPGDLGRAQGGAPGQVVGGGRERLEVQDRCAPAPDRHAQLGVERGQPGRQRPVRLGEQLLELGRFRLGHERRVDVMVHERERADAGVQQAGPGRRRVSHAQIFVKCWKHSQASSRPAKSAASERFTAR